MNIVILPLVFYGLELFNVPARDRQMAGLPDFGWNGELIRGIIGSGTPERGSNV